MAKRIKKIAELLEADVVAHLPDVGPGYFGAARLERIVSDLKKQLRPAAGRRPGRPTKATWGLRPKVPMSQRTKRRLEKIAKRMNSPDRKVSPMQVAGEILERVVAEIDSE
jgi:hypothetical protein